MFPVWMTIGVSMLALISLALVPRAWRGSHDRDLGYVSDQWLAEHRVDAR
jgi:hypothetical protein